MRLFHLQYLFSPVMAGSNLGWADLRTCMFLFFLRMFDLQKVEIVQSALKTAPKGIPPCVLSSQELVEPVILQIPNLLCTGVVEKPRPIDFFSAQATFVSVLIASGSHHVH